MVRYDRQTLASERCGRRKWRFFFAYDHAQKSIIRKYVQDKDTRKENRLKLNLLFEKIVRQFPQIQQSSDQNYRESDLAIDICEDISPLSNKIIRAVLDYIIDAGAQAKISSIHINAWYGDFNKLTTSCDCLKTHLGICPEKNHSAILYIGDSPNDEVMFDFFHHAVGVANIKKYHLDSYPQWITHQESATGFVELVDFIIQK